MKRRVWLLGFLISSTAFVAIAVMLSRSTDQAADEPILVYCAAGIREPVEAAAKSYGKKIELQFGGSNTLLANAEVSRRGDLFIAADDSYLDLARQKGLAAEVIALARQSPVLAVAKGNPKNVRTLADLLRGDVKLCQANPDATAVGKIVRGALEQASRWSALKEKTLVFKTTVNEVANDLKIGSVDAGFVWDATLRQYPELEAVSLPELNGLSGTTSAIVLRSSASPTAALRFARFLSARDRGQLEFRNAGHQPVEGDAWTETPEILVYSGAMLRPAIDRTIQAFEHREGCRVTRVYNGCGILVAQMSAGARPDMYFACDQSFMDSVKDQFPESHQVSINQLVILVQKGNPHKIKTLNDLGKPGVKLGIGHEKQCALGAITQTTLAQSNLRERVMKNVATQVPAGDLLVNQMRVGSLDAAIAYVSNATGAGDALEAIPIDIPCALAYQPVAVAAGSKYKQLAGRLMEALRSTESRRIFESEGFRWKSAQ